MPAERTLLLDYITPNQLVALRRAIQSKHTTVASSISIFVLIKVLTIISTGLLTLDVVFFEGIPQQMRAITSFNGSEGLSSQRIDARAATAVYGAKAYDMRLPNGTTDQYAYQLFEPLQAPPNGTYAYNASVEVFTTNNGECETGTLTFKNATSCAPGDPISGLDNSCVTHYSNTTIKLPDCEIRTGQWSGPQWNFPGNDSTAQYIYATTVQAVNCSNLDPSNPRFNRLSISVIYSINSGFKTNIFNSCNIVCVPSYQLQSASISLYPNGTIGSDAQFSGASRQLENISTADIVLAVKASLDQAQIPYPSNTQNATTDNFIAAMIALTPGFETKMLMDPTWLAATSTTVYQQHAAQLGGLYLLGDAPPDVASISGFIARNEQRLVVKSLPTRLMQSCAGLILVLTLVMMFTMARGVVPRPIESIAAIAVILARSPNLNKALRNTGHLTMKQLRQIWVDNRFMSTMTLHPEGRRFSIQAVRDTGTYPNVPPKLSGIKWFRPIVLRRIVMAFTLLFAAGVLIALEVLYRESQEYSGIANVDPETLQHYAWLYVPTVVLILLATTFNVLDFELEFAHPYHELARKGAYATASLLWDPLRTISVRTALQAMQHSQFALAASSISVIFAPFLTIIASGLLEARPVPYNQNITAMPLTWFTNSPSASVTRAVLAYPIPALILQDNMSYPQWTWDEMAFPSVDLSSITNDGMGTITVETPATRAHVDCTLVSPSDYHIISYNYDTRKITYIISQPGRCGNSSVDGFNDGSVTNLIARPLSGNGYIGAVSAYMGRYKDSQNDTVVCPTYYVVFGKMNGNNTEKTNLVACYTGLETVQTNATITLDLETVTDAVVDESMSTVFNDYYWPEWHDGYVAPSFALMNFTHNDESFDSFTNVMVYGKDGIPAEELLDSDVLIEQFTHTYRQFMAQWMNTFMRNSIDELAKDQSNIAGDLPGSLEGVYSNSNRQRLFLNEISTRLLQGVIAFLLLCGGVIFVLVDMSKVLPKPVGTIGAVASLLAGSRLVDEKSGLTPEGRGWLSDKELKRRGIWAGEQFRMGWWNDDDDEFDEDYNSRDKTVDDGTSRGFRIDMRPKKE